MNIRYMTRKADPSGTGARVVYTASAILDACHFGNRLVRVFREEFL